MSLIGYINYFKSGTVLASDAESSLPVTNLGGDQVNSAAGWQTHAGVLSATLQCAAPLPALEWRAFGLLGTNLTNSASITIGLWQGGVLVTSTTVLGPFSGYRQSIVVLARDYTADNVVFTINDPSNPDGFISIAGAFAGPGWLPLTGITWDTSYGTTPNFRQTQTEGGQIYSTLKYRQRYWNIALDGIRDSEAWDDLAEMVRVADVGGNVLFVPNIYSVDIYREAVFGTLRTTSDVTFPARATDQRSWRGQVLERL